MKSLHRILAVVLAVIMLLGTLSVTAGAASVSEFSDFPAGTWSEEALTHSVNNGLLQGKGDGTIAPKDYITRAEVATIINRAFGATVKADISKYTDMDPSKWYYAEIQKAVNMQTVVGVSETEINPEGYITRESVFTIIARAMVLSSTDSSALSKFADGSAVSSWALSSVNAMAARGYVNGDEKSNLNPGANITREEFAQVMYNVFKTYLPEGGTLSDATYGTTVVRGKDLTLKNITVNGDLVIADGVGNGNLNLINVDVSGRILFRGGEGKVTIDKNSSVGEFVIVHDVNGTVNFNNYKTENIFKGIVLDTAATFLTSAGGSVGGGGGGGSGGGGSGGGDDDEDEEVYTITFEGINYTIAEGGKIGDAKDKVGNKLSDVIAIYTAPGGYKNEGFINKATGAEVDFNAKATGDMEIEPVNVPLGPVKYDVIYDAKGGKIDGNDTYVAQDVLDGDTDYTLDTGIVPEREGYTFAGWYIDTVGQAIVTVVPAGTADVTVYAKWEENAHLTFSFDSENSNDTTVAIKVEIDKLPYGVTEINSIVLNYEYFKSGTTDMAELTYSTVTAPNGVATGNASQINWTGSVTSGGTLFTIIFTKDKSVGYDVDFKFGDVTIKEDSEEISGYDKVEKTINIGTGKAKYEIIYNDKSYYAYEDEKIGDAKDGDGNKLSDVLKTYTAPAGYTNFGFKNKVTGTVVNLNDNISASMEIEPNNVLNTYDLIYNANGGTVNGQATYTESDVISIEGGHTLDTSLTPEREGHRFLGWYMDASTETIITSVPAGTADVTVYAKWEEAYVITYNGTDYYAYEGDKIGDAEDKNGNKLSDVLAGYTAPEGYRNEGFKNSITNAVVDLDADATESIKLAANDILNTYDVIYNANGGTVNGNATYTANDVISIAGGYTLNTSLTPEREGHRFLGWYMDTATETIITSVPAGTADVTVYAKWEAFYVITYGGIDYIVTEGGKIGDAEDENGNKLSDVLAGYTAPEGYRNEGFKNSVTNAVVDLDAVATESMKIEPIDVLKDTYNVIYDANGGKINGNDTYVAEGVLRDDKGYTLDTGIVPQRSGFKFVGWYMDTATETIITSVPAGTANVTVYAKWEAKGKPELGFAYKNDTDERKVTLYVTLSDIPYNMDDLAGIMIYYSQVPEVLDLEKVESTFRGTLSYNKEKQTISWYNNSSPITADKLSQNDNVLFTLTFGYDASTEERVVFSYVETELAASDLTTAGVDDYTTSSVTININKSVYIVTFGGNTYEIVHGGKLSDNERLKAAMEAVVPTAGYKAEFKGTYILGEDTVTETVTLDTVPSADMTIEVVETAIEYTIKYYSNGEEIFPGEATYTVKDLPYTLPNLSDTEDYTFGGWFKDSAFGGNAITEIEAGITGDLEFFAKWVAKDKFYTITFGGNTYDILQGSKLSDNERLKAAMEAVVPEAGYEIIFKGTYISGGSTVQETVTLDTVPSADMTIEVIETAIEYTIKYYSNGKEIFPGKATYTVKDSFTLPVLPNTEEDNFEGWYDNDAFDGNIITEIVAGNTGNLEFFAKWDKALYTVTLYEGTTKNKGSYEIPAGGKITQSQIDAKLGAPATYTMQEGYVDSDGNTHEIAPELWYKVGSEWEIFKPEEVVINRDIDVHLFTRFAIFYYDTDLEVKGVKIPRVELSIAYDSNTDIIKSGLDTLTALGGVLEGTIDDVEMMTGIDLFQTALDKAAKTGLVDAEGNILNPEVPVPLHKLITEDLIMGEIDNYIDANINNEEFIADILRNDTVVDMLLGDKAIREKVLSDESMRNKLLTDSVIKEMISKDSVIDWIFNATDFKEKFINSDETFDYIIGDIKELLATEDYHKMIIDACVDFVIGVYFEDEQHDGSDALIKYIDSVLDSDTFIEQIETNKELRPLFKEEIKELIAELADKPATDPTKKEIYDEIRGNATIKQSIIDTVVGDENIMADLREQVREDLKKPAAESKYRALVVEVIESEFDNSESTLKDSIVGSVQTDLKSSTSTLRGDIIEAIKQDLGYETDDDDTTVSSLRDDLVAAVKKDLGYETDDDDTTVSSLYSSVVTAVQGEFSKDESDIKDKIIREVETDFNSATPVLKVKVIEAVESDFANGGSLKGEIIDEVKAQVSISGSALRNSILAQLSDSSSDVAGKVKDYVRNDTGAIKVEIFEMAKDDTQNDAIKNAAKNWIETNIVDVKDDIRSAAFGKVDTLKILILESGVTDDEVEASGYAYDYIYGGLDPVIQAEINSEADAIFGDVDRLKSIINGNFKAFYDASVDTLFDKLYVDATVFNAAYESFIAAEGKLEETFDDYIENGNLEIAVDAFISAPGKLAEAIDEYVKVPANLTKAINKYVADGERLKEAINFYIENGHLEEAIDFYIEDGTRLTNAINTYIDTASDTDIVNAINIYIESEDNLIVAVNKYIEDDSKLIEIFNIVKGSNDYLMKAFDEYIKLDANLDEAFGVFTSNPTAFDNFYETHLGVNAQDPELFNTLFEDYYHAHVHVVAKSAYDEAVKYKDYESNPENSDNDAKLQKKELYELIMDYVYEYTDKLVMEYANNELEENHPELVDVIDSLMHNELPQFIRDEYENEDSEIRKLVDELIEEEGRKLIDQYVSGSITDEKTLEFIDKTIKENIDVIVDGYVDGTLRADIKQLVDDEIDTYMNKLINDYINDVGDARETLGDLIPTYAQDAVDALKDTDAFKNTISDFVSGNGVRVNEGNIMFISILSELMGEYDFDRIMADFAPEKATKLINKVGHDLAEKYVNALLDTFVGGIKDAESKLQADLDNDIEGTEYKFTTTPRVRVYFMQDVVEDAYNKAIPKIEKKLLSKNALAQNPYVKKLLEKNWLIEFLDYDEAKVSEEYSGYSIKKGEYNEIDEIYGSPIIRYYNIILENVILLHDAVMWYGTTYEGSLEAKLDAVSELLGTYANKANDVIMHYIQTGELPKGYTPYEIADKILNKVLGVNDKIDDAYDKFEDKYYENEDRILELVAKVKNFYEEKLNKDYTEVIDLANISIYADGKAYPVYKIMLELYEENEAFSIDTLATAIFDSDNYHGINVIEKGMNKVKSVIERFKYNPGKYEKKIVRDAYKATLDSREIKGKETGSHSVEVQRYLQYMK